MRRKERHSASGWSKQRSWFTVVNSISISQQRRRKQIQSENSVGIVEMYTVLVIYPLRSIVNHQVKEAEGLP